MPVGIVKCPFGIPSNVEDVHNNVHMFYYYVLLGFNVISLSPLSLSLSLSLSISAAGSNSCWEMGSMSDPKMVMHFSTLPGSGL